MMVTKRVSPMLLLETFLRLERTPVLDGRRTLRQITVVAQLPNVPAAPANGGQTNNQFVLITLSALGSGTFSHSLRTATWMDR